MNCRFDDTIQLEVKKNAEPASLFPILVHNYMNDGTMAPKLGTSTQKLALFDKICRYIRAFTPSPTSN